MINLLKTIEIEAVARANANYESLIKLSDYFLELYKVQNISHNFAMDELNIKLAEVRNLNERISDLSKQKEVKFTPQISSNKLDPLLQCASQFVQNNFEEMIDNNIKNIINISPQFPLYFKGDGNNLYGTSAPNCAATAYFLLSEAMEKSLVSKKINTDLYLTSKPLEVFDTDKSPILQSTPIAGLSLLNLSEDFKKQFIEAKNGKDYLKIPTLGYAFGGDRDYKYDQKEGAIIVEWSNSVNSFANQDCSSWVAKLVKAKKPFSTFHMKMFYNDDPSCDQDDLCRSAKESLEKIGQNSFKGVSEGDIFLRANGHTGVVFKLPENESSLCFSSVSYNRNMPEMEGGPAVSEECILSGVDFMFFASKNALIEDFLIDPYLI